MTLSDPTDEALATIASILEHPQHPRAEVAPATVSPPIAPVEADGYTRIGPGPMAAIRFKWSARRSEHDAYFVDETIGENSAAVVIGGPMNAEDAIRLVDARESEARHRFDEIRREMISGRSSTDAPHNDEEYR